MDDLIALVGPLVPALRRYARAQLRDADAADDLVQDCLERAVSRWGQRRSDGDARSWTYAILHNLILDRMRRTVRRGVHVAIEDADPASLSVAPSQEASLQHRALLAALDDLPEDQSSVLLLIGVEGLTYAQAADSLGVPVGTVMSRLSRGRERLLRLMDPDAVAGSGTAYLRRVK